MARALKTGSQTTLFDFNMKNVGTSFTPYFCDLRTINVKSIRLKKLGLKSLKFDSQLVVCNVVFLLAAILLFHDF